MPGMPSITIAMDAVEVHGVRVHRGVHELHAQPLAFAGPQRGTGHTAVVGPRRIPHTRRHLDLAVLGHDLPLPHAVTDGALVEVAQDHLRIEAVGLGVDASLRAQVARSGVGLVAAADRLLLRRGELVVHGLMGNQLVQERNRRPRRGRAPEELAPRNLVFPQLSHLLLLKHGLVEAKFDMSGILWPDDVAGEPPARPRAVRPLQRGRAGSRPLVLARGCRVPHRPRGPGPCRASGDRCDRQAVRELA